MRGLIYTAHNGAGKDYVAVEADEIPHGHPIRRDMRWKRRRADTLPGLEPAGAVDAIGVADIDMLVGEAIAVGLIKARGDFMVRFGPAGIQAEMGKPAWVDFDPGSLA